MRKIEKMIRYLTAAKKSPDVDVRYGPTRSATYVLDISGNDSRLTELPRDPENNERFTRETRIQCDIYDYHVQLRIESR